MLEYLDIVLLCLEVAGCRNLDPLCIAIVMSQYAGRCGFKARIPNSHSMVVLRKVIGADSGRPTTVCNVTIPYFKNVSHF
jgi:hypothetical protein